VIRNSNGLAALFGRLTDSKDRETYAALISFVDSLPEGDELFRLVELLGLLSLVGQRVPDALGEFLQEVRAQTKATANYHGQVDARLGALPQEIAAGVDVAGLAKAMSERFRQQLSQTGLQDTAQLLRIATETINRLSAELTASLKPAASEFRGVTANLTTEITKLLAAARQVEQHNAALMTREKSNRWSLQAAAVFIALLVGGLAGIVLEKRQTADLLTNIGAQIERIQSRATLPIAAKR